MNLDKLLKPASIAIIGASNNEQKVGNNILKNLIDHGFKGMIYPINLIEQKILGLRAFPSVLNVKENIDLAIVAVPAKIVPQIMEDIGRKGIPFAIIISAGFKEIGSQGQYLETKVKEIAKKYNIRFLGPNCLGIINLIDNVNASFSSILPRKGNIAFISQSGALCSSILSLSVEENFGFSKFISIGNKEDLNECDLIEYLSKDLNTDLIMVYLESISDISRFREVAFEALKRKPIVIIKAGITPSGMAAVASHTGSMAGEDNLFNALFNQIGIIRVSCLAELFDSAEIFSKYQTLPNPNLAILTNGGGIGVITADSCENKGIKLAKFSSDSITLLRKVLPASVGISNPLDVIGDAGSDRFENAINILKKDSNVGIILIIVTPQSMTQIIETAKLLAKSPRDPNKPIICCFIGNEAKMKIAHGILKESSIPNFEFPEMAVNAVEMMSSYTKIKENIKTYQKNIRIDSSAIGKIIGKAKSENRRILTMKEGFEILNLAGIMPAPFVITKEFLALQDFLDKEKEIFLKIDTSKETHKTEKGFVSKKISSLEELRRNYLDMKETAEKHSIDFSFLAQKSMLGSELLLGAIKNKHFGTVVSIGFGGIYTEVLKDISFGISPISNQDIERMIQSLKLAPLFKGFRNQAPLDINYLINTVFTLEKISTSFKEISEIEINPLMLSNQSGCPVDIKIRLDF